MTNDESDSTTGGTKMGEAIKKLLATGVSAAFMTEESIRRIVSDLHLPKETLNMLLQGASRSKEELMNRVSREVIGIISKIDFVKEASRFVEEHKFRIVAEVEVLKKPEAGARSEAEDQGAGQSSSQTSGGDSATMGPESKIQIKL
ncbi:MAG: hypothetical protein RBT63_11230 [Bdellovibrionales bacterium]|jgi:hypothetical protein|nr:hypothetical protein [Bdellovibrionales bacterium]